MTLIEKKHMIRYYFYISVTTSCDMNHLKYANNCMDYCID